jgi:hypothetical protein
MRISGEPRFPPPRIVFSNCKNLIPCMLMRFISLEKPPYGFLKFQFLGHRWTMYLRFLVKILFFIFIFSFFLFFSFQNQLMMKLNNIWIITFNCFRFIFHMFQNNNVKIFLTVVNRHFIPKASF